MRLLEIAGYQEYPVGGGSNPCNFSMVFDKVILKRVKEIELDDDEMIGFYKLYGQNIPYDLHINSDDFYFWGIHFKRIK